MLHCLTGQLCNINDGGFDLYLYRCSKPGQWVLMKNRKSRLMCNVPCLVVMKIMSAEAS